MSAATNGTARSQLARQERADGPGAATVHDRGQGLAESVATDAAPAQCVLARLADFAARRAELATEEAEYLAEVARVADPGLAERADPSVHAPVTTGFHPAEYLTQAALGDLIGAHPRTVRRMELAGELPDAIEIGRLKRWRRSTVQTWLDEGCPKPRRARR